MSRPFLNPTQEANGSFLCKNALWFSFFLGLFVFLRFDSRPSYPPESGCPSMLGFHDTQAKETVAPYHASEQHLTWSHHNFRQEASPETSIRSREKGDWKDSPFSPRLTAPERVPDHITRQRTSTPESFRPGPHPTRTPRCVPRTMRIWFRS